MIEHLTEVCQNIVLYGAVQSIEKAYGDATIQACATYLAAVMQANMTMMAAEKQWNATIIGSICAIVAAFIAALSLIKQTRAMNMQRDKEAARAEMQREKEAVQRKDTEINRKMTAIKTAIQIFSNYLNVIENVAKDADDQVKNDVIKTNLDIQVKKMLNARILLPQLTQALADLVAEDKYLHARTNFYYYDDLVEFSDMIQMCAAQINQPIDSGVTLNQRVQNLCDCVLQQIGKAKSLLEEVSNTVFNHSSS